MSNRLEVFLLLMPVLVASLTLHELAHGYTARALGDPTAQLLGRLSPNPIRHLDVVGSGMFVLSYWAGGFLFGWAKPVPVDPSNLRGRVQTGMALIGAAGPLTNFVLALIAAAVYLHVDLDGVAFDLVRYSLLVNIVLGVFNLLPIPPLDGSRIVGAFMDRYTYLRWSALDQYGIFVLLGLFLVFQQQFSLLIEGATEAVADVLFTLAGGSETI